MRIRWALVLPLTACIADISEGPDHEGVEESAIVNGTNAAAGKWPDVAAVMWAGQQTCTGTLVAPSVVLTAGHCNDQTLDKVLLGATSLARPSEGETIAVTRRAEFPASQSSEDVTVLVLKSPSKYPPRAVATGWARADIQNGARVEIAGFGAIDRDASQFKNDLQEAETAITDFDCSTKPGCNVNARPAGELGAGGDMGVDTCNGDSGGPLYLLTPYGAFLAGVTSRGYEGAGSLCGEGGIYARPDKILQWIEDQAGERITRGPEPTAETLYATRGNGGEAQIEHHDPLSDSHSFSVKQQPQHGLMVTRDDGRVRFCAEATSPTGDSAIVTITDKNNAARSVDVAVPIMITDGTPAASCDLEAFSEGGGCCDSGRSARGSLPLALGVLLALRRRRRR